MIASSPEDAAKSGGLGFATIAGFAKAAAALRMAYVAHKKAVHAVEYAAWEEAEAAMQVWLEAEMAKEGCQV